MNKEYRLGSSSNDRKLSLILILDEQLKTELLKQDKIDSCFEIIEVQEDGKYYFRINELPKHVEVVNIPRANMMPYKLYFSFKDRFKILLKGKI